MITELAMELRGADLDARTITGTVVPYDEVSYLVPDPAGERIARGAFAKSVRQRGDRIPLFRNHDHGTMLGSSRSWADATDGLTGVFRVRPGELGDAVLEEVRDGWLPGLSVGFRALTRTRGGDGVTEVREAQLAEVSLVTIPAYDSALVTREAQPAPSQLEEAVAWLRDYGARNRRAWL